MPLRTFQEETCGYQVPYHDRTAVQQPYGLVEGASPRPLDSDFVNDHHGYVQGGRKTVGALEV
jgi:hypothetical protein